jgi:hypothetical protein
MPLWSLDTNIRLEAIGEGLFTETANSIGHTRRLIIIEMQGELLETDYYLSKRL